MKLLYIRDYLYAHATIEHLKNARHIKAVLSSKNIEANGKTSYTDIKRLEVDFHGRHQELTFFFPESILKIIAERMYEIWIF